jgi:hypothetical protein
MLPGGYGCVVAPARSISRSIIWALTAHGRDVRALDDLDA